MCLSQQGGSVSATAHAHASIIGEVSWVSMPTPLDLKICTQQSLLVCDDDGVS